MIKLIVTCKCCSRQIMNRVGNQLEMATIIDELAALEKQSPELLCRACEPKEEPEDDDVPIEDSDGRHFYPRR